MNCHSARAALPLHVGNDLPPSDAARVAGHLESCAACRSREADLRRSQLFLREAEPPRLDADEHLALRRAVIREIERRAATRTWPWTRTWSTPWVPAFALAAAATVGLGLLLTQNPPPSTTGPASHDQRPPTAVTALASSSAPATVKSEAPAVASAQPEPPAAASVSSKAPARRRGSVALRKGPAASAAVRPVNPGSPLQIELQTANPNVRIIWIVPSTAPQAAPDNA